MVRICNTIPTGESLQDQLKNKLKKREELGARGIVQEKKPDPPLSTETNFQDQLKNRLKKRQDGVSPLDRKLKLKANADLKLAIRSPLSSPEGKIYKVFLFQSTPLLFGRKN